MYYYSPQTLEPVFRTTAITMRKNPILSENYIGYDLFPTIGQVALLHLILRQRFPRVKAINYLAPYTFAIQFKPNSPGEVNRMATFAMGGFGDLLKNIIVVDEDIDPFDLSMVFFSLGTRVDSSSNRIQIIKDLKANRHDPASEQNFLTGGLIIDSTKPVDKPFPEIGSPPAEILERIKIQNFLKGEEINQVPTGKK
jgi:UbiD family decarboxylase